MAQIIKYYVDFKTWQSQLIELLKPFPPTPPYPSGVKEFFISTSAGAAGNTQFSKTVTDVANMSDFIQYSGWIDWTTAWGSDPSGINIPKEMKERWALAFVQGEHTLSGTTYLASQIIRDMLGGTPSGHKNFPHAMSHQIFKNKVVPLAYDAASWEDLSNVRQSAGYIPLPVFLLSTGLVRATADKRMYLAYYVAIRKKDFIAAKRDNIIIPNNATDAQAEVALRDVEDKVEDQEKAKVPNPAGGDGAATDAQPTPKAAPSAKSAKLRNAKEDKARGIALPAGTGTESEEAQKGFMFECTLSNIALYTTVVSSVLKKMHEKVKSYSMSFNTPVDLSIQAENIELMGSNINSLVSQFAGVAAPPDGSKKIKFMWNDKFELQFCSYAGKPISNISGLRSTLPYNSKTTNKLIYSMLQIYWEYQNKWESADLQWAATEDNLRNFFKRFIYPKVHIMNTKAGEYIVEKYLLGDPRLLNDDFWKKYQLTSEDITTRTKLALRKGASNQYEKIGDALGFNLAKGKFKEIKDFDDFYEQVMDHIDMKHMFQVAAVCLMKLIDLDEWIEKQCRKVLENFDAHRAKIIGWLESQDDPVNKALATELKNLLFAVEDHYIAYFESTVTAGAQKLTKLVTTAWHRDTWQDEEDLIDLRNDLIATIDDKHQAAGIAISPGIWGTEETVPGSDASDPIIIVKEPGFWDEPSPLDEKVGNQLDLFNELTEAIKRQETRMKELGTALPLGEKNTLQELREERNTAQQKLNKLRGAQKKAKEQMDIAISTLEIFRRAVLIDPFLEGAAAPFSDKARSIEKGAAFAFGSDTKPTSIKNINEAIEYLNSPALNGKLSTYASQSGLGGINANSLRFKLNASDYIKFGSTAKTAFELQIVPKITLLLQIIESKETGPDGFLNSVTEGAIQGAQSAVLEMFDTNKRKRLMLCAAIFAAVPAAVAGLIYLIENWDDVTGALTSDLDKVEKAIKRRLTMFFNMKFEVMDLLKALKETAVQIGLNLIRDIVINTILWLIKKLEEACKDEEKQGAPYSPVGQLSLSDFVIASQTENNTTSADGVLEEATSFATISSQTELSLADFTSILDALSGSLTIRELCSALDQTAAFDVYDKAVQILEATLSHTNSAFYEYYVNMDGIRVFFKLISQDIKPEYCIIAQQTYEKEKQMLLNICGGLSDDVLVDELSEFLNADDALKRLAMQRKNHLDTAEKAVDVLGDVFNGDITPTQECGPGGGSGALSPYDDSQGHAANYAGDAIYKSIERAFEMNMRQVKDIYSDAGTKLYDMRQLNTDVSGGDPSQQQKLLQTTAGDWKAQSDQFATNYGNLDKVGLDYDPTRVANRIRKMLVTYINVNRFLIKYEPPTAEELENEYDQASPPMQFYEGYVPEGDPPEADPSTLPSVVIQKALMLATGAWLNYSLDGDNYGLGKKLGKYEPTEGEDPLSIINILTSPKFKTLFTMPLAVNCSTETFNPKQIKLWFGVGDPVHRGVQFRYAPTSAGTANTTVSVIDTTPGKVQIIAEYRTRKFGLEEPLFYDLYQNSNGLDPKLNSILFCNFARPANTYEIIINNIFEGLLRHSTNNGLYNRQNFDNFHLNIYRPFVTHKDGTDNPESCFLGFLNHVVLNKQTQKLIEALACFSPNAIEKSSSNISFIKMLLDCLVRILVVKETMKTLFTFGAYNKAQLYTQTEGEESFFYIYFRKEVVRQVRKHFASTGHAFGGGTRWFGKKAMGEGEVGTWSKFQAEIMDEWVVGIMKILYQDEDLDADSALNLIIEKQMVFVQELIFRNIPASILAEQATGFGAAYQVAAAKVDHNYMIENITPGEFSYGADGMAGWLAAAKNVIDLENLSSKAKMWTIENAALSGYLNPIPALPGTTPIPAGDLRFYSESNIHMTQHDASSKYGTSVLGGSDNKTGYKRSAFYFNVSRIWKFLFASDIGEAGGVEIKKCAGEYCGNEWWYDRLLWMAYGYDREQSDTTEPYPPGSPAASPTIAAFIRKPRPISTMYNMTMETTTIVVATTSLGGKVPFITRRKIPSDAGPTTAGIDSGLVRETYVKIKYNPDFYHNLTLEQRTVLKATFRKWTQLFTTANWVEAKGTEAEHWDYDWATYESRTGLFINFLYETKLILFFPQMVDLLVHIEGADVRGITQKEQLAQDLSVYEDTDILWNLFQHNFAGGVSESLEPGNEDFDPGYMYQNYPDLKYAFQGKIYLSDWLKLIKKFNPPTRYEPLRVEVPVYGPAPQAGPMLIDNQSKNATELDASEYVIGSDLVDESGLKYPTGLYGKAYWGYIEDPKWNHAPIKEPPIYDDASLTLETVIAQGAIPGVAGTNQNAVFNASKSWMSAFYEKNPACLWNLFSVAGNSDAAYWGAAPNPNHFFLWLLQLPVKDIYDIEFGTDINQYISEEDSPGVTEVFRTAMTTYNNFQDEWALCNKLISEKIGTIALGAKHYVAMPLFNSSKGLPDNLTYFGYIYKAGGAELAGTEQWIFTWPGQKAEQVRWKWTNPKWEDQREEWWATVGATWDPTQPAGMSSAETPLFYSANEYVLWRYAVCMAAAEPDFIDPDTGALDVKVRRPTHQKCNDQAIADSWEFEAQARARFEAHYPRNTADAMTFFAGQWAPIPIKVDYMGNLATNPQIYNHDWGEGWPGPLGGKTKQYPGGGPPPRWVGLAATPKGTVKYYRHVFHKQYVEKDTSAVKDGGHHTPNLDSAVTNKAGTWRGFVDGVDDDPPVDGFVLKDGHNRATHVGGGQERPEVGWTYEDWDNPTGLNKVAGAEDNVPMNYVGTWWKFVTTGGPAAVKADTVDYIFGQKYNNLYASTLRFMGGPFLSTGTTAAQYQNSRLDVFFGMMTEEEKLKFDAFIHSFFLKEQTTMMSVIHRMLSETFYPELEFLFDYSLSVTTGALLTAIAVANGDYKFVQPSNNPGVPFPFSFDIDWGAMAEMILKAMLGGLASAVDPTWRTDWFLPGPFTPIGVAAKLLIEKNWCFGEKECEDPKNPRERKTCDDALDAQIKLIDLGPFFNK